MRLQSKWSYLYNGRKIFNNVFESNMHLKPQFMISTPTKVRKYYIYVSKTYIT